MSGKRASSSVLMTHAVGLHARPSVKLTKLAKTFESRIELAVAEEGPWIDAKSVVKVMATKAPKDTKAPKGTKNQPSLARVDAMRPGLHDERVA